MLSIEILIEKKNRRGRDFNFFKYNLKSRKTKQKNLIMFLSLKVLEILKLK